MGQERAGKVITLWVILFMIPFLGGCAISPEQKRELVNEISIIAAAEARSIARSEAKKAGLSDAVADEIADKAASKAEELARKESEKRIPEKQKENKNKAGQTIAAIILAGLKMFSGMRGTENA